METPAKERLTGAVILVTLIVLLVPELLSGPGKVAQAPAAIAEPATRSYVIDLVEGGVRPQTQSAPATESAQSGPAESSADAPLEAAVVNRAPQQAPALPQAAAEPAAAEPVPVVASREAPNARSSGWAVQLGSFASRENARRLARELEGKGYEAFVLEGGGARRNLYRVRVGPEPDRAAAVALAARLRSAGRQGTVVEHP